MKTPGYVVLLLLLSLPAYAEEELQRVDFPTETVSAAGEVLVDGLLFELEEPGITTPVYALKGMIRYQGIEGDAYLQMDNDFGDKGSFFTKTLATAGPLKKLRGSSDWRPFVLPFYANSGDESGGAILTPDKLTVSLHRPGSGEVFIRDVILYQYAAGEDPMQSGGAWFGNRTMALVGAIGGTLVGLWGGLIGFLASRGKARGFVLGSTTVLVVLGIASVIVGTVVLATGQPYGAYYPLLLVGAIIAVVFGNLRRVLPQRYGAMELKKMQALDA